MPQPLTRKFGLADLRQARASGQKLAMLTCYDATMARLMQAAGVPLLLVGDSAGNVVMGHGSTVPVTLDQMTQSVRRGAPLAYVIADMPFGSYHGSSAKAIANAVRVVKESGCDAIKLEVTANQFHLMRELADAGIAVFAHLGLRPQSIGVLGNYRYQGRTASEAGSIVHQAQTMEDCGAVAILLEAVPPEVSARVVERTEVPVIGCGAGPACHGHVVVTHDLLGLTDSVPRFVPVLSDLSAQMTTAFDQYVQKIAKGEYPAKEHEYAMPAAEREAFQKQQTAESAFRDFDDDDIPF
jgi:3-methyl-2-oxobutanoate hydroxymethyltransferase